jgi:hypothetical protein
MKALLGIITVLAIPLMVLNMLGGIASGIWLAIIGEWGAIGWGIAALLGSTMVLGFALMPSVLLAAPAVYYAEKGNTLGILFFAALSNAYVIAIVTVWCCGVLYFFVKDATSSTLIPTLIWSYGVATGPWAYMASKDQQTGDLSGSAIATFFAELAYVGIMIAMLLSVATVIQTIMIFAGIMFVGMLIQISIAFIGHKQAMGSGGQTVARTPGAK